jgi:histidinol dehydrogenase
MDKFQSKILKTNDENFKEKFECLLRSRQTNQSNLYKTVYDIIEKVKKEGDLGLKELVQNFDKIIDSLIKI